jgi:hypothetical protein
LVLVIVILLGFIVVGVSTNGILREAAHPMDASECP